MRLTDSSTTVTLDLHGASLAEARRAIAATVRLAASRGRSSVRIVHGSSTSDPLARNATIKHVLEDMLYNHALADVTDWVHFGDVTTLSLPVGRTVDRRTISLRDVW